MVSWSLCIQSLNIFCILHEIKMNVLQQTRTLPSASFCAAGQMQSNILWGISCLSAASDHDSTLCPSVGVWECTSPYHKHRLISGLSPTSAAPPLTQSLGRLTAQSHPACYHHGSISRATVFGSVSPHSTLTILITRPTSPQRPLSSPSSCLSVNHLPLSVSGPVPGPCEPEDLIDGIIFAANYLGSTQLLSERNPSKNIRMMQAQEAVSRVKVSQNAPTALLTHSCSTPFVPNIFTRLNSAFTLC